MDAGFRANRPLGYQQITTLSAAVGLTIPDGAAYAVIIAETQAVRWRDDGTAPTATVGQPLAAGVEMVYANTGMTSLRFIEQAPSAKLNVTFYA